MSQIDRMIWGGFVTIAVAIVTVMYIRAGLPLLARVSESGGPMAGAASNARTIIPVTLALIEGGTLAYVVFGPVQEEKKKVTRR